MRWQGLPGLLVCGFGKDGTYIVAGANDCNSYVWHWDLWSSASEPASPAVYGTASFKAGQRRQCAAAAAGAAWPQPEEVCRLTGHRHDVVVLHFSHDGEGIATGSKDGSVRVRSELMP